MAGCRDLSSWHLPGILHTRFLLGFPAHTSHRNRGCCNALEPDCLPGVPVLTSSSIVWPPRLPVSIGNATCLGCSLCRARLRGAPNSRASLLSPLTNVLAPPCHHLQACHHKPEAGAATTAVCAITAHQPQGGEWPSPADHGVERGRP